jgi:regulator of protease activity HflC (stomatin/prohibitin superfamily)
MATWNWQTQEWEHTSGVVTIYEYQRGALYHNGVFERILEAGRYRLWPWSRRRLAVLDIRRASAQITNQKLLTKDQITITLNIVADYEIADVAAALHRVANFRDQLYADVQLAARNIVGEVTVDELLEQREALNVRLLEMARPLAEGYGLRVLLVAIKDVVLAPKVRDMLMKEAEARRTAQAMLIGAREEVVALRALSNAARLAAQHPHLLRLRELETVRAFASTPGNTVVVGVPGAIPIKENGVLPETDHTENEE